MASITSRTNAEPLSLALLKEHVPHVKAGQEAKLLADEGENLPIEEKQRLRTLQTKGSKSQETLIISGLPLIKNIASKEFQRRKAWSSRISYDDVLQEAIAGFIRGLLSYDENTKHNSPTNYLSMWITTTIRRRVEAMEHDFAIPYEVVERARRIRAVTSRLHNELSRDATDEEILDALNNATGYTKNVRWGAGDDPPTPKKGNKKFTQTHLEEARNLNKISYGLQSYDTPTVESDETYEKAGTPLTSEIVDSVEQFEQSDLAKALLAFYTEMFMRMEMGSKQQDLVLRFSGLGEYQQAQSQKEIISHTGLPPRFVKNVITAFHGYMPVPGGWLHYLILNMDPDRVDGLELSWLFDRLGEWPDKLSTPVAPPSILTQNTTKTTRG